MNSRTIKYKNKIRIALYELLTIYSYEEITITKLCKQAKISRQGFYLYYKNIDEIIIEQSEELWDILKTKITYFDSSDQVIGYVFDYYKKLQKQQPKLFSKSIRKIVKPIHEKNIKNYILEYINKNNFNNIDKYYRINIEIKIVTNMFEYWIENDFNLTKEEFLNILETYINWEFYEI